MFRDVHYFIVLQFAMNILVFYYNSRILQRTNLSRISQHIHSFYKLLCDFAINHTL